MLSYQLALSAHRSADSCQLTSLSLTCQLELPTFACTLSIRLQALRWLTSTWIKSWNAFFTLSDADIRFAACPEEIHSCRCHAYNQSAEINDKELPARVLISAKSFKKLVCSRRDTFPHPRQRNPGVCRGGGLFGGVTQLQESCL